MIKTSLLVKSIAITSTFVLVVLSEFGTAVLFAAHTSNVKKRNLGPVIGVFSQQSNTITGSSTINPKLKAELEAYRYMIPASYVTWNGRRVLPILLNHPWRLTIKFLCKPMGSYFRTGNQDRDPDVIYTEEGEILWNMAKQANDRDDDYPI